MWLLFENKYCNKLRKFSRINNHNNMFYRILFQSQFLETEHGYDFDLAKKKTMYLPIQNHLKVKMFVL